MKLIIKIIVSIGLLSSLTLSQVKITKNTNNVRMGGMSGFHRICLNDKLSNPAYLQFLMQNTARLNPQIYKKMIQDRSDGVQIQSNLGDKKNFWALNILTQSYDAITAQLLAIGNQANIWVDTNELANNHVTKVEVEALLKNLENSTPAGSRDSTKGILQIDENYYGYPPNKQGDGKVDFLILDIKDGFNPPNQTGWVAGYFNSNDQYGGTGSNGKDMLYIDSYPTIYYKGKRDITMASQTTAHEFQHLIAFHYDPGKLVFINEACSQNAEIICGFDAFNGVDASDYFDTTNVYLLNWNSDISDYSRATLWLLYTVEQIGDKVLKSFAQNNVSSLSGIINVLASVSSPYTFFDILKNWSVANFLNDRSYNPVYGYKYPVKDRPGGTGFKNPNINDSNTVSALGIKYVVFSAPSTNFKFHFITSSNYLTIKMVATGPTQKKVMDITPGKEYPVDEFSAIYDNICFIITNTSESLPAKFGLISSGNMIVLKSEEISYDNGKPKELMGSAYLYLPFQGAGFAVKFTPNAKKNVLKKVRLWLAFDQEFPFSTTPSSTPKSFYLHIWDLNPDFSPGADIISPVLCTINRPDSLPKTFYDIGLDSYSTLLTNRQNAIFVGFTDVDFNYPPRIGIDNLTPQNYSFAKGIPDGPEWTALSDLVIEGSSLGGWNAMIRADFLYDLTTGVQTIVEQRPDFSLNQNYPNPFNPETTIEYSIPDQCYVKLTMYDLLGRKIKDLINENQTSGKYNVVWNGEDNRGIKVTSGVYIYKLEAGNFSQIKKLNLIK